MRSNGSTTRTRRTSAHRPIPANVRAALAEVKAGLEDLYGERLHGIYLYGSYARGDYRTDSDIDLLIVLAGPVSVGEEIRRTSGVVAEICLRYNLLIAIYPSAETPRNGATSTFLQTIDLDAVRL